MGNVKWIQRPLSRIYKCIIGGTSGGEEPSWDRLPGNTTNDGGVTWICEQNSRTGISNWQVTTVYKVGNYVRPSTEYGGVNYESLMSLVGYDSYSECFRNPDGHVLITAEPFYDYFRYPQRDVLMERRPVWVTGELSYIHFHMKYEGTRLTTSYLGKIMGFLWHTNLNLLGSPKAWNEDDPVLIDGAVSGETYIKTNEEWDGTPLTWGNVDSNTIGFKLTFPRYGWSGWVKIIQTWLEVEFIPDFPFIETNEITDITNISFKGNGEIKDISGGNYTERGFEYYKDGYPDDIYTIKEEGDYGLGSYNLTIPDLETETKYYVRAWAKNDILEVRGDYVDATTNPPLIIDVTGKSNISTLLEIILVKNPIINIKATKSAGHLKLYGEILESEIVKIVERGFEYKIQDEEPGEEDTGTEVKEEDESGFDIGEYHLSSWDTYNDLYCAEEDTIWWFRAYLKDLNGTKHIAKTWMKNVPILVTSECTETTSFSTKGHGELTDIGANIVTERGFHIIKEFSGSIFDIHKYTFHGFTILSMRSESQYAPNGVLIGFLNVGELLKVISTEDLSGYSLEEYELDIGTGILNALLPNDIYKVKAFGKNELGRGFGEEVEVTTGQVIIEPETEPEGKEPIESPTTAIKTVEVKADSLPIGYKVVRMGIKYGRTPSCNEGIVYEDGEWYNGDSVTFFIVDLIPGEKYYEAPFMIIEDPEGEQDEIEEEPGDEWDDEFPPIELPEWPDFPDIEFPLPDLVGIDYAIIIKEIKCSIIADQSIIDKYGRRRTLTIKNNLIQTLDFCISIRDDYLIRFQELKLKIDIDYDIPLPFEREDTILLAYGQINYRTDGNGVIGAKADGEGIISGQMSILTKIRKININAKTEEAILTLELEV